MRFGKLLCSRRLSLSLSLSLSLRASFGGGLLVSSLPAGRAERERRIIIIIIIIIIFIIKSNHREEILKKWVPKNQPTHLSSLSRFSLSPCVVALRYSKRKNHHHHHHHHEKRCWSSKRTTTTTKNNTSKQQQQQRGEIFVFETQNPKQKTHTFFFLYRVYLHIIQKKWQRPRTSTSPPRNRK